MIYLLGNSIHMRMEIYKFRIRFETYKNLNWNYSNVFIIVSKTKVDSDRLNQTVRGNEL